MSGALAFNVMRFARLLRRAGMPIGTGRIMTALEALQAIDIGRREDVYWALHATFVDRHAQSELFRLAFERFWRTQSSSDSVAEKKPTLQLVQSESSLAPRRLDDAFGTQMSSDIETQEETQGASWSGAEILRRRDFETMAAAELAEARTLMRHLRLPLPEMVTRRFRAAPSGARIDMRATLRAMVRTGAIDLRRRKRIHKHPPLVVLCDISGSMGVYARMLLHFLHVLTNDRDRVHTFLFGTRLTNVTREMAHRDPDEALARVSRAVQDWSGGTRIGEALGEFNRLWSRRVLGQGAVVLLITDGLERDDIGNLAEEMERRHKSCRRLIWLNPLLRFDGFEARALQHEIDHCAGLLFLDRVAGAHAIYQRKVYL